MAYQRKNNSLLIDIETMPLPDAIDYLDPSALEGITPPSNYTKDEAKANYILREQERIRREHVEKAALDPDLCRIAVIGWLDTATGRPTLHACQSETEEAGALTIFWRQIDESTRLSGFNILVFDLPVLYRRSLYLNVRTPFIQRERYRHQNVIDLLDIMEEQGRLKKRSVAFYCKRFGIDNPDPVKGKDVPKLIAEGRWDDVVAHCRHDLIAEHALAVRLGVLEPVEVAVF